MRWCWWRGVDVERFRPCGTVTRHEGCLFVGRWLRDFACLKAVTDLVHRAAPRVRFTLVLPPELVPDWSRCPGVDAWSDVDDAALLRAYQESALLVMPLQDTTANNAVLEAMACGLPVVATDVGGMRDYVDRDCARLVPAGRPEAMAEAILDVLQDPVLRSAMAQAARARAESFAWPRVAKQILAMYETLR
jgi:glycosyltransferase involved in cell wall biosynthesis